MGGISEPGHGGLAEISVEDTEAERGGRHRAAKTSAAKTSAAKTRAATTRAASNGAAGDGATTTRAAGNGAATIRAASGRAATTRATTRAAKTRAAKISAANTSAADSRAGGAGAVRTRTAGHLTLGPAEGLSDRTAPGGVLTLMRARPAGQEAPLFTRAVLDYAAGRPGQRVTLLQAGCATAGDEPDLDALRAAGCDLTVSLIDDDVRPARATVTSRYDLVTCTLCDLRMAPLVSRSFDIVHCALLLERISHAELVLDRLTEALKPGGLLLLQTGDRDCATGFLDRVLPRPLRATVWRNLKPGAPGPYPAVYERLVSERGIESYVLHRGLVIAQRQALSLRAGRRKRSGLQAAARLTAGLSRGRLTAGHDELRYIIRKPENRFARVL
jgi:SAM-dependent methyltransferase